MRPGIVSKDSEGKLMCKPIFSKIVSLFAEHNDLQYAVPGGLIGMSVLHLCLRDHGRYQDKTGLRIYSFKVFFMQQLCFYTF